MFLKTMSRAAILCVAIFGVLLLFHKVDSKSPRVIVLDEDNWEQMLTGEWMVKFYAPWCPACRNLEPVWADFSSWSEDLNVKVAKVDVTKSPGLSGRFMVTALPTIYHVNEGEFRQYRDSREQEAFFSFVEKKKWQDVEPIPYWKSPHSVQMSLVSKFFKFSQLLRSVHVHLMKEYGLPTWGSYIIFAVATILLGALLGLLVVCIIDRMYPSKPVEFQTQSASKSSANNSGGEGDEDLELLKDDLIDEEGLQLSSAASSGSSAGSSAEDDKSRSTPSTPGTPGTPGKARQRRSRKSD